MEAIIQKQKKPKLTRKQKGFVKDYVLEGNGTQAALKHYDINSKKPEKVASVIATENLAKPSIQDAIVIEQETLKSALIDKGITPKKVAEKVSVLLEATEDIYRNNNKTGKIEKVGTKVDFNAVDKGLKHATNIYGITDPNERPGIHLTYNFLFNEKVRERIRLINQEIKQQLINASKA